MICPYKPESRKPIHYYKMAERAGYRRHGDTSHHANENVLPPEELDNPGADSSGLTDKQESTYENSNADSAHQRDRDTEFPARRRESQETVTTAMIDRRLLFCAVTVIVVSLPVLIACKKLWYPNNTQVSLNDMSKTERERYLRRAIGQIREEFPSQLANIWPKFSAGIKETAQGAPTTRPSVFMMLYETEEGTPFCLAQKIGNLSTHFLDARKLHPLIIEGADLEHNETLVEDYGLMLEEYRPKVEEQRTVIINNLHKIPGKVAQSFHSFCDSVSPVVEKAVFFFTMKAPGITNSIETPTEVAEKVLIKLWSDKMENDVLNPLITRITDMTMMIKPELNLVQCEI